MLRLRALIPSVELHCATQARKTADHDLQPFASSPAVYSSLVGAAERGSEAEPGTVTPGPDICCFRDKPDRSGGNGLVFYPVGCEVVCSKEMPNREFVRSRRQLYHLSKGA